MNYFNVKMTKSYYFLIEMVFLNEISINKNDLYQD